MLVFTSSSSVRSWNDETTSSSTSPFGMTKMALINHLAPWLIWRFEVRTWVELPCSFLPKVKVPPSPYCCCLPTIYYMSKLNFFYSSGILVYTLWQQSKHFAWFVLIGSRNRPPKPCSLWKSFEQVVVCIRPPTSSKAFTYINRTIVNVFRKMRFVSYCRIDFLFFLLIRKTTMRSMYVLFNLPLWPQRS